MNRPASTVPTLLTMANRTDETDNALQEQLRLRAYELYNQRGQIDGHDIEDWCQAEAELGKSRKKAAGA